MYNPYAHDADTYILNEKVNLQSSNESIADTERNVKVGREANSKIPSIFDHVIRNSSTIKSYYQQQWAVQVLEELRVASYNEPFQWESFFTHLEQGMTRAAVTWEQVELFTGIKKHVLLPWFNLSKIPSLETILKLCYVCEVTPLQVMRGEITSLVEVLQRGVSSRPSTHRRTRPTVDLDRCRELIQAVLDGREKPMSQNQLCKVLGCGHHKLQHFFPEERALIIQKAREYRKQQDRQRIAKTHEQVRQAVFSLHMQGIYPSLHKVQSFLSAGVMLQSDARETWHAALRELGLEP